ncbi:unnamed protein product [Rangifer tarandus platyrhynchus]|uniref:Uncharacterized protein n=1 Tax=Rangifer tarandus platyrhynchus TaxID=3082113 RepID=A0AC59Z557_RANTA
MERSQEGELLLAETSLPTGGDLCSPTRSQPGLSSSGDQHPRQSGPVNQPLNVARRRGRDRDRAGAGPWAGRRQSRSC